MDGRLGRHGLITVSRPREDLREVVNAFRRGGGEYKPMFLQAKVSYSRSEERALTGAWHQWRTNIFDSSVLADLRTPEEFESIGEHVVPEDMYDHVRISSLPLYHEV